MAAAGAHLLAVEGRDEGVLSARSGASSTTNAAAAGGCCVGFSMSMLESPDHSRVLTHHQAAMANRLCEAPAAAGSNSPISQVNILGGPRYQDGDQFVRCGRIAQWVLRLQGTSAADGRQQDSCSADALRVEAWHAPGLANEECTRKRAFQERSKHLLLWWGQDL